CRLSSTWNITRGDCSVFLGLFPLPRPSDLEKRTSGVHTALASRGVLSKTPSFLRVFWLFRADSGRVSRFGVQPRLGCPSDLTSRQEGFAMHFSDEAPDSKTGLITGDFESEWVSATKGGARGKQTPWGSRKACFFFGNGGVFRNQTNCEQTVSRKGQRRKSVTGSRRYR